MTTMRNPKNSVVLHVYKWPFQLYMDGDTFQQNYINFTLILMLCSHGTKRIFDQLKICAFTPLFVQKFRCENKMISKSQMCDKNKFESPTGFKPMTSQTLGGHSIHLSYGELMESEAMY